MIHKRLFSSVLLVLAVALIASLWMVNLISVQASPLYARKTKTPTPTATPSGPTATPLPASNYYVSVTGSDSNNGSQASPWRHIQYAMDRVVAGNTVHVMNGVYNETVTFRSSGSAGGGYITLQNFSTHTPVIDGTGLPIVGEMGLVVIENRAYVKLIGFEIRNLQAGGEHIGLPCRYLDSR